MLSLEDPTAQWEKSTSKSAMGEVYIGGSTCTGPVEIGWWGKHRRVWWSIREDFLEVEDLLSCVLLDQRELAKQSGRLQFCLSLDSQHQYSVWHILSAQ